MNNSPSDIFYTLLLLERYHLNCQAVLAATSGMNGLTHSQMQGPYGLTQNEIS